ncbi:Fur-regulated basic protein FbpA [Bacillus sp. Marseille-Q1617]|uniref:Fur-regulated basic protein FbpA n=1 Tax=Bacillus sp. Marseille-Q1617 TaxID=2736887 RepID=UPI00158B9B77|nr:Fur-regulated basic protein FbpA [Bacillus sp. Marseille-Q1617]
MGKIIRHTLERRREELINKLITYNIFKKNGKQLFELTLQELEKEYQEAKSHCHPHSSASSIHWKNVKARPSAR